ncbi:MAG: SDR family NAD(P)-dependent oxidoreductase, partial [Tepidisphaeraceae bacterium]
MTEKRVAIVTGGSRGIGAAIVKHLAKQGVHVVAAARGLDKLQAVVDEVKAAGGSAEALSIDLSNPTQTAEAIEKVAEAHGRIDILVNNGGITKDGLFMRMEDADFDEVINTNLKSAFVTTRAAARYLMRSKSGG